MSRRFQSGGALREGAIYVERRADRELPGSLLEGAFCHVLAPRQMGKSSLRARVEATLRAQGVRCGSVDLTALGTTQVTAAEWYFGLLDEIARSLSLGDPADFWHRHALLSPVLRWSRFLRDEVLARADGPVIVFLDEIDAVRSLPFSADDFFASIRALYNARATDPACERLRFCMMGVAAPGELIQDAARTPFNIGRGVRLEDFTRDEARAFLPSLAARVAEPEAALDEVLGWTEGHPYMTQRTCEALERAGIERGVPVRRTVAGIVSELFLKRGRVEDLSLSAVDRLFARDRGRGLRDRARAMLSLYRRLLAEEPVLAVSDDPVQTALRLAGLSAERDDGATVWVRVRNPIIASVFDETWVAERLAEA